LERSVKHLKRMAWRNKEEVYGLVGKLKEGRTLPELCAQMKEAILKKKSNRNQLAYCSADACQSGLEVGGIEGYHE
jgi:hypothetical protein